jgi:hypothetical protein
MHFVGEPLLPDPLSFPRYLAKLAEYLDQATRLDPGEVLARFIGFPVDLRSFHIGELDHAGVYVGDYEREDQLEAWLDYLREVATVREVRWGPSYIAPRYHGTPGYWINCRLDSGDLEMFSCKHAGPWRDLDHPGKLARMSHFALSVDAAAHVKPVLDFFAHYPGIELLAFSATDELGHTYGHLVHQESNRVLELVHASAG